jgi:hypothetical protein
MCNSGVWTSDKKWIKMIMKTSIHINSKEDEIIVWCSFDLGLCLFLSSHRCCMCCHHQWPLHHICASWINNDKVHQSMKAISNNKNIHSLWDVKEIGEKPQKKKKVKNLLLNMCFPLQSNNYNIFWNVLWAVVSSLPQGHRSKHTNKESTLALGKGESIILVHPTS